MVFSSRDEALAWAVNGSSNSVLNVIAISIEILVYEFIDGFLVFVNTLRIAFMPFQHFRTPTPALQESLFLFFRISPFAFPRHSPYNQKVAAILQMVPPKY